jgi:hypothetical protein
MAFGLQVASAGEKPGKVTAPRCGQSKDLFGCIFIQTDVVFNISQA